MSLRATESFGLSFNRMDTSNYPRCVVSHSQDESQRLAIFRTCVVDTHQQQSLLVMTFDVLIDDATWIPP